MDTAKFQCPAEKGSSRKPGFRYIPFSETWVSGKRGSRKRTDLQLINHQTSPQTTEDSCEHDQLALRHGRRTGYESHQLRWFVRFDYGLQGFDICVHTIDYAPKLYL